MSVNNDAVAGSSASLRVRQQQHSNSGVDPRKFSDTVTAAIAHLSSNSPLAERAHLST